MDDLLSSFGRSTVWFDSDCVYVYLIIFMMKIGSIGHAVVPELHAALQEWAAARQKTVTYIHKGTNCFTEMYSAIAADVIIPSDLSTQKNAETISFLQTATKLIVCGEALSHCVAFTTRDIVVDWPKDKLSNIYLLRDGKSSLYHINNLHYVFVLKRALRLLDLNFKLSSFSMKSLHKG